MYIIGIDIGKNHHEASIVSCMIIRKLIITYFLSFNIVVQYNSDTMDF